MTGLYVRQSQNAANSATTTITAPSTGDLLVWLCNTSTGGGTPTVTQLVDNNSTHWTQLIATYNSASGSGTAWNSVFYLANAPATTTSVTATFNGGTPGSTNSIVIEVSGAATAPTTATAKNTQNAPGTTVGAITSTAATISAVASYMLGVVMNNGDSDTTAVSPFTNRYGNGTDNNWFIADNRATVTGSNTFTATAATHGATDDYTTFLLAFSEPSVAPSSGPLLGQNTPTTGGSGVSNNSGSVFWPTAGFVCYAAGTLVSLNCYCTNKGTASNLMLALYDVNGNLVATTVSTALALGINTINTVTTPALVYGQTYYPAWQADAAITLADDGTTFKDHQNTNTYGTMPSTIPVAGGTIAGMGLPSIWATGTLATGAAGKPLGGPARAQMHWR